MALCIHKTKLEGKKIQHDAETVLWGPTKSATFLTSVTTIENASMDYRFRQVQERL